jgi:hypothetical protein
MRLGPSGVGSLDDRLKIFNAGGYRAGDGGCAVLCRGHEVSRLSMAKLRSPLVAR